MSNIQSREKIENISSVFSDSWKTIKLGDVCETKTGGTPSRDREDFFNGDIPWVKSGALNQKFIKETEEKITEEALEESSAREIPKNTLLIALYGATSGKIAFLNIDAAVNQAVCAIFTPNELDDRFLFWFLKYSRNELLDSRYGGAQKNLSQGLIQDLEIPLPPKPEQKQIVEKIEELFSKLDAGVDDLETVELQLERYRQSVLKFAVEGKLTKKWRESHDTEPVDQLLKRIQHKRREKWEKNYRIKRYDSKGKTPPDGWKDRYTEAEPVDSSDLPSIPASWKWVRFEQICLLDSGYAFSSDDFTDEGIPLLRGANIAPGNLKWDDTEYWPENDIEGYEHLFVEEGDIILAMDRPLISEGLKIARAEEEDTPCLLVQRVARFKPVLESLTPLLYLACSTQRFINHLREGQTGTQVPHVSKKSLRAFPVPLPSIQEQEKIAEEVERNRSIIDKARAVADQEQKRSSNIRQSILKKAFEGELV